MTDCPELASVTYLIPTCGLGRLPFWSPVEPVLSRKLLTVGAVSHRSLSRYKEARELAPFAFLNPLCVLRNKTCEATSLGWTNGCAFLVEAGRVRLLCPEVSRVCPSAAVPLGLDNVFCKWLKRFLVRPRVYMALGTAPLTGTTSTAPPAVVSR